MKSRAELLAEIEEKRQENSEIQAKLKEFSLLDSESGYGYNPYDNPGMGKELPDDGDIAARRRKMMRRLSKR